MLKYLWIAGLALMLVSCSPIVAEIPNTTNPIQNVDNRGTTLVNSRPSSAPEWVEASLQGIDVGVWLPAGWQYDDTGGLTLVEHMSSIHTGEPTHSIMVYFFVPALENLVDASEDHDNLAYAALHQVSLSPSLTGAAEVTPPVRLLWGEIDAAYYAYSAPQEVCGWVLAFAVPDETRILVANITAPRREVARLAEILPPMLSDLRINRQRLGEGAVQELSSMISGLEREAG
jgi:hypothetical protein